MAGKAIIEFNRNDKLQNQALKIFMGIPYSKRVHFLSKLIVDYQNGYNNKSDNQQIQNQQVQPEPIIKEVIKEVVKVEQPKINMNDIKSMVLELVDKKVNEELEKITSKLESAQLQSGNIDTTISQIKTIDSSVSTELSDEDLEGFEGFF